MLNQEQIAWMENTFANKNFRRYDLFYRTDSNFQKCSKNLRKWVSPLKPVFLIYNDAILFSYGKNGAAFSDTEIFCKSMLENACSISYAQISELELILKGEKSSIMSLIAKDTSQKAYTLWQAYALQDGKEIKDAMNIANLIVGLISCLSGIEFGTFSDAKMLLYPDKPAEKKPAAPVPDSVQPLQTKPVPNDYATFWNNEFAYAQSASGTFVHADPQPIYTQAVVSAQSVTAAAAAPPAGKPAPPVFLCCAQIDRPYALQMKNILESNQVICHIEPENIYGKEDEIFSSIQKCPVFLILFTKNTEAYRFFFAELEEAVNTKSRVIIINMDNSPIPLHMRSRGYDNLYYKSQQTAAFYQQLLEKLKQGENNG